MEVGVSGEPLLGDVLHSAELVEVPQDGRRRQLLNASEAEPEALEDLQDGSKREGVLGEFQDPLEPARFEADMPRGVFDR